MRTYAEELLQALRAWQTHTVDLGPLHVGSPRTARFQVIGIGGCSAHGHGGLRRTQVEYIQMPGPRQYTTGEVVSVIQRLGVNKAHASQAALLERIRAGQGPSTLLRENGNGWAAPTSWSKGYAQALFLLAIQLGDPEADCCLSLIR
ncbi:hypothetical protein GO986_18770 [Deinococcus sp. HMF7620]|uniref:Uncharacterized protein n=1 Tax=Deinococcus arboris TaxID=2682977 RepID=A0A7C9IE91_9DEIO|nr:hypothetical protein [Deinococcus arboris]MVN88786.1 hypothetical protein [Deinococcus arboris]